MKDKVLSILEQHTNTIVTGGELSKQLGVSRTAVWKAVGALQKEGYEIESFKNSGYKFISENDVLSETFIRKKLTTKIFGNRIEILKTVDSTNLYLKRQDLSTMQEGFVVVADEQTNGQGRMNRVFYSPCKEGIYMSLLLKPDVPAENVQFLTICAAVGVCRAIENVCGIDVKIKWVNDIFYNNKKLCGILTEAVISAEIRGVEHVIVGIGVNTGAIQAEVADIATSISRISGKRGYRNKLIAEILKEFEETYFSFMTLGQKRPVLDAYVKKLFILNKRVQVIRFNDQFEATVAGVAESGALIVKDDQGKVVELQSGEVKLLLKEDSAVC